MSAYFSYVFLCHIYKISTTVSKKQAYYNCHYFVVCDFVFMQSVLRRRLLYFVIIWTAVSPHISGKNGGVQSRDCSLQTANRMTRTSIFYSSEVYLNNFSYSARFLFDWLNDYSNWALSISDHREKSRRDLNHLILFIDSIFSPHAS